MKIYENIIKKSLKRDKDNFLVLDLHKKEIGNIENINEFLKPEQINIIDLSYNYLKEIQPIIKEFKNILLLDLSMNLIKQIKNISPHMTLQILNLSMNQITTINLKNLPILKKLDLSTNNIEIIEYIDLPELEYLFLNNNKLDKVEGKLNIDNLKELDISKNNFTNLDFLNNETNFKYLETLKCNFNQLNLEYFNDFFATLNKITSLKNLECIGNEITLHKQYKFSAVQLKIRFLDEIELSGTVRVDIINKKFEINLEEIKEKTREEYLLRIKEEYEQKKSYKNLLNERKNYVDEKFQENDDLFNSDIKKLLELELKAKETNGENIVINQEIFKRFQKKQEIKEKEREKLLEKAAKRQEEQKKNFLDSKLISTTLNKKLYEISMNQPDIWREIKQRELQQQIEEENAIINENKNKKIIDEEGQEFDEIENEFKSNVANLMSEKIRSLQTKELQKEKIEAITLIQKNIKPKLKTFNNSPLKENYQEKNDKKNLQENKKNQNKYNENNDIIAENKNIKNNDKILIKNNTQNSDQDRFLKIRPPRLTIETKKKENYIENENKKINITDNNKNIELDNKKKIKNDKNINSKEPPINSYLQKSNKNKKSSRCITF